MKPRQALRVETSASGRRYVDTREVIRGELERIRNKSEDEKEEGCLCGGCGGRYKVDVQVDDALWNRIRPHDKPEGAGLLCGRCILSRIEVLGEFDHFSLKQQ